MKIVLIGGPGSGKGTMAKLISKEFDIPHISTGDLCRNHVKEKGKHSEYIKKCLKDGNLVSDEVTLELLNEKLEKNDCEENFILDGFPRTIEQAKKLGDVDHVLFFNCSEDILIRRLTSRRICKNCGQIYNLKNKNLLPKIKNKCDKCSSELIQRNDDKEEIISSRIDVYKKQTKPLLQFYQEKLKEFDVSKDMDDNSMKEIFGFLRMNGPVV